MNHAARRGVGVAVALLALGTLAWMTQTLLNAENDGVFTTAAPSRPTVASLAPERRAAEHDERTSDGAPSPLDELLSEPTCARVERPPKLVLPGDLPPLQLGEGPRRLPPLQQPPMAESRALIVAMEGLLRGIGAEIRAADGDPKRVTKALERFQTESRREMKRSEQLWKSLDDGERSRLSREVEGRLRPLMNEILRAMKAQGIQTSMLRGKH